VWRPGVRQRAVAYQAVQNSALALALSGLVAFGGTPARGQTLGTEAGDLNGTVAGGQNRRTWDSRKQNGGMAVDERNRKQFQPDGIRSGNFMVFGSGEAGMSYDDNVFGTARNRVGDFAVQLAPRLQIKSLFPRHALNLDFGVKAVRYAEQDVLNHVDANASANGALHINHAHTISFALQTDYAHESRLALSAPSFAKEKTPVWNNRIAVGLTRDRGRLSGTIGASYESWDFSDVKSSDGTVIDQDVRDTAIWATDLNLKYRFSPGYAVLGRIRGARTLKPNDDRNIDSWGYDAYLGVKGEASPLFHWRLLGGYGSRDFDNPSFDTANATLFELSAKWIATQRLNIEFSAEREIQFHESDNGGPLTKFSLHADIDASKNLLFTIGGAYSYLRELDVDQTAEKFNGFLSANYLHSKHLHFSFRYDHTLRWSEQTEDLTENRVWFGTKILF